MLFKIVAFGKIRRTNFCKKYKKFILELLLITLCIILNETKEKTETRFYIRYKWTPMRTNKTFLAENKLILTFISSTIAKCSLEWRRAGMSLINKKCNILYHFLLSKTQLGRWRAFRNHCAFTSPPRRMLLGGSEKTLL